MNKSVTAAAVIVLLLGLWMLSGILFGDSSDNSEVASQGGASNTETSDDTAKAPMKVHYALATAAEMKRSVTLQGQLEPIRMVTVRAQTSGLVEELPFARGSRINEGDLLARLSLDGRKAQLAQYQAQVKSASSEQKAASRLNKQGLQSQLQLEQASARLASARASLQSLQLEINNTQITAPFNGVLNKIDIELGSLIERGTAVAELVDDSAFKVTATATQQMINQLQPGQPVVAKLITGEELPGKISFISAIADSTTRSFSLEAEIEQSGKPLPAGVSASLDIPVENVQAYLISPSALALGTRGEMGVKVANIDNIVEFYQVKLISTDSGGAWVTGIPDGAKVITLGQGFVNAGDQVEPVAEPDTNPDNNKPAT